MKINFKETEISVSSITEKIRSSMTDWLHNTQNKVSGIAFKSLITSLNTLINELNEYYKEWNEHCVSYNAKVFPKDWNQIKLDLMLYDVDQDYENVDITFYHKLRLENTEWSEEFTKLAIHEYKRFMFLILKYKNCAPPYIVDQVWHLHILYTKDYRNFCMMFNKEFIDHNPDRYYGSSHDSFKRTINLYKQEFGEYPPEEIWFNNDLHSKVSFVKNYIIPVDDWKATLKLLIKQIKNKF